MKRGLFVSNGAGSNKRKVKNISPEQNRNLQKSLAILKMA
jgi:hypothetical protein